MRNEKPKSWRASLGNGPAVTVLDSVTRRRASKLGGACVRRIFEWWCWNAPGFEIEG